MKKYLKYDRNGNPIDDDDEVVRDGQTVRFSHMFMDATPDEVRRVLDAKYGRHNSLVHDGRGGQAGHRPGHCYSADETLQDAAQLALRDENLQETATLAYEERRASLGRLLHGQEGSTGHGGKVPSSPAHPIAPKEAAELARAANEAYVQKVERLRNAWKERPEVSG
jgi:hypothetical protein